MLLYIFIYIVFSSEQLAFLPFENENIATILVSLQKSSTKVMVF